MSENNIKIYKTSQARLEAVKRYRSKKSEVYINGVKESNKRYYQKRKEYSDKYKELLNNGLLEKLSKI